MRVALDTNRYTDLCRGESDLARLLESADEIYLPFVVVAELRAGFAIGRKGWPREAGETEGGIAAGAAIEYDRYVIRNAAAALALAVALPFLAGPAGRVATDADLLVRGAAPVDPEAGRSGKPVDILIAGGRILEVAAAGTIDRRRAATLLEASGLFVLPGLIDVHAHIGDGGLGTQSGVDQAGALAQFVRYGVTTIFVPGGGGGNEEKLARWKARCDGELLCPDLFGSGSIITAPGGYPISTLWHLPLDADPAAVHERGALALGDDADVGAVLDAKVARGIDAVKIVIEDAFGFNAPIPRLSKERVCEIAEASHERGLKVFAHVSLARHFDDAVACGVDGVMHSANDAISTRTLAAMAKQGTFYVATLSLFDGFFDRARGLLGADHEPYALAGASRRAIDSLRDFADAPFDAAEEVAVRGAVVSNLLRAAHLGVPLALGSDANNPTVFPGYSAHEELELMVAAGLTPARALAAATLGGAAFLGRGDRLGRIAPGFEADLLLLAADPLIDILATRTLRAVLADGVVVEDVVTGGPCSS